MLHRVRSSEFLALPIAMLGVLSLAIPALASSRNSDPPNAVQETFASPADAGAALFRAVTSGDLAALIAIFGPETTTVLFTGDAVEDKNNQQDFLAAYNQMHRWGRIKAGGQMLYLGADNFPFPIPVDQNPSGQWYFDTAAGKDEILARRIGRGELNAIAACRAIADAERQYFSQTRDGEKVKQYAQKFVSDEGRQNGLYWSVPEDQTPSPLSERAEFAKAAGYTNADGKPQLFDGYYFQILTKQGAKAPGGAKDYVTNSRMTGGFAIVAYPAKYGDSGIMTFIVGEDGVVYQQDLGEQSANVPVAVTEYNPGEGWTPVID